MFVYILNGINRKNLLIESTDINIQVGISAMNMRISATNMVLL